MDDRSQHVNQSNTQLDLCFILGISQRSGTNYLQRLLKLHPACAAPGPIWEDGLLRHSASLVNYVNIVYNGWHPNLEVEKTVAPPDTLLNYLGDALCRFLNLQVSRKSATTTGPAQQGVDNARTKLLLTKTPSVHRLENFFRLFPNAHLLIIIRDGRAVVESGARSFGWNREEATRNWAAAASVITRFKNGINSTDHKYLIVKYEDICSNTEEELRRILLYAYALD